MDNSNPEQLREWVLEQTAYLDPPAGWDPDTRAALDRLHTRRQEPRKFPWRWVAVAAAAVVLVLVTPVADMTAQLWQMLTVHQVAIIQVSPWPNGVPSPAVKVVGLVIPPIPARDTADAQWRVHYQPRLPSAGVLSGNPRLSTTFSVGAGTVIRTADLELALQKAGITGQTVPPQWDGAQLTLRSSALVIAEWPELTLVQSLPLTLAAPPGFDFPAFSALILRILGVSAEDAQRLAQRTGTTPPWLAPLGRDILRDRATLEEITLNSGPATLLQDGDRHTILWMTPDRVYLLTGKLPRDLMISAANSVQ